MVTRKKSRRSLARKFAAVCALGCVFHSPLGSCNLDDQISTTTTVSLNGRDVITQLINSAIITPLQDAVANGVDAFFDQFDHEHDE